MREGDLEFGCILFSSIRNDISFDHPSSTTTPTRGQEGPRGGTGGHGWARGTTRGHVEPRVVFLRDFAQFPYQPAVFTDDFA